MITRNSAIIGNYGKTSLSHSINRKQPEVQRVFRFMVCIYLWARHAFPVSLSFHFHYLNGLPIHKPILSIVRLVNGSSAHHLHVLQFRIAFPFCVNVA